MSECQKHYFHEFEKTNNEKRGVVMILYDSAYSTETLPLLKFKINIELKVKSCQLALFNGMIHNLFKRKGKSLFFFSKCIYLFIYIYLVPAKVVPSPTGHTAII